MTVANVVDIVHVQSQVDDGEKGELRDVYKGSEVNHQLTSLTPGRTYRYTCSTFFLHNVDT